MVSVVVTCRTNVPVTVEIDTRIMAHRSSLRLPTLLDGLGSINQPEPRQRAVPVSSLDCHRIADTVPASPCSDRSGTSDARVRSVNSSAGPAAAYSSHPLALFTSLGHTTSAGSVIRSARTPYPQSHFTTDNNALVRRCVCEVSEVEDVSA